MLKVVKGLFAAAVISTSLMSGQASALSDFTGPWQLTPVAGIPFWVGTRMAAVWPGYANATWSLNYTPNTWHHPDSYCTSAGGSVIRTAAWVYGALGGDAWAISGCNAGETNFWGRVHVWG